MEENSSVPNMQTERLNRDKSLESIATMPLSAREAPSTISSAPAGAASNKPPGMRRRLDAGSDTEAPSIEFVRVLRSVTASGELDEASLHKIEAHAGDRKTQEAARLLREVQIKLAEPQIEAKTETDADKSGALNKQQTDAQIAFMERKIAKLREKLKRRTKELALLQDVPREATGDQRLVDLVGAADDDLGAEANYLRNEVQRLKNDLRNLKEDLSKSSPRGAAAGKSNVEAKLRDRALQNEASGAQQALKQRLQESQQKLRVLNAETEASVKNAEAVKKQIQENIRKIETKLKETVVLRESEQIKLLAEQQTLEKRIVEQEGLIKTLEKKISAFEPAEFDRLRERVHQVEKDLTVERQKVRAAETRIRGLQATSVADTAQEVPARSTVRHGGYSDPNSQMSTMTRTSQVSGEQAPATFAGLDLAPLDDEVPTPPKYVMADYERILKEIEDTKAELKRIETELTSVKDAGAAQILSLESATEKHKVEVRNEIKLLETQLEGQLWEQLSQHKDALETANSNLQHEETELVATVQKNLTSILKEKREEQSFQKEEALAKIQYFEGQSEFLQQELLRVQHQNEIARLHRDFRGTFFLTLRRCEYDRDKVLHYLSKALKIPMDKIRVWEETVLPDGTHYKQAVRTTGEPLEQVEDRFDAVLRRKGEKLKVGKSPQASLAAVMMGQPGAQGSPGATDGMEQPEAEGEKDEEDEGDEVPVTIDRGAGGQLQIGGTGEDPGAETGERTFKPVVAEPQEKVDETLPETLLEDEDEKPAKDGLVRLSMEILPDATALQNGSADKQQCEQVARLAGMIGGGKSILEDLAVVSISTCRGEAVLNGQWPIENAEMIGREARYLGDRYVVITSYLIRDPCVLKIIAVDNEKNEEYILYMDETDLKTLLGPKSRLLRPEFAEEMAAALIEMLHVVTKDSRRLLLTIHSVQAPPTVLNQLPMPTQSRPGTAQGATVDAPDASQAQLAMPPRKVSIQDTQATEKSVANAMITDDGELETVFEDVIIVDQRFFTFLVRKDPDTSTITLQLQEAGVCQPFEIVLPGAEGVQQLRVYAQAYEFTDLTLMVTCEEIATPPSLVIRIAKGDANQPAGWRDPHEQVFWIASEDFRLLSGSDATVSAMPSQKREQLLGFVHSEPPQAKALIGARATDPAESTVGWKAQYGVDGDREGMVLCGPVTGEPERHASEALAMVLLNASKANSGKPLLRSERRVATAGGEPIYCSVTVSEHQEPYLHFAVFAQEVKEEGGREWAMFVDSVEVFRALRKKFNIKDYAEKKMLATEVIKKCELVPGRGASGLRLVLPQGPSAWSESAVLARDPERMQGETGSKQLEGRTVVLARQLLSQADAAKYFTDDYFGNNYLLVKTGRKLDFMSLEIRIFNEPTAPEAMLSVSNLLVIGFCAELEAYYSLRLNDKALMHTLLPEERFMLQPEHQAELLERVIQSLDLCYAKDESGVSGTHIVMQPYRTIGQDSEKEKTQALENKAWKPMLALGDAESDARPATPLLAAPATGAPPQAVEIGGHRVNDFSDERRNAKLLRKGTGQLGKAEVQMTLESSCDGFSHVFSLHHPSNEKFEVQIPSMGNPTRVYIEHRMLDGVPVLVAMAQQPFPHEVQAIVVDTQTQEELPFAARDSSILPLMERSLKERFSEAMEQFIRYGCLGDAGSGASHYKEQTLGREMLPANFTDRALQNIIPVARVRFEQLAHEIPRDQVAKRDLLYGCSRYVVGPEILAKQASLDADTFSKILEDAPLLHFSISKKSYCHDFTISIENSKNGGMHMLHIRDKLVNQPLAVYGEVQQVGDLELCIFIMDDYAPRALRVCVLEPLSGWSFQLVIVDSDPTGDLPFLDQTRPRHDILKLYNKTFSCRKNVVPQVLMGLRAPPPAVQLQVLPTPQSPPKAVMNQKIQEKKVLKRATRSGPGGRSCILSVVRELTDSQAIRFRVRLHDPCGSAENSMLLVNPGLDIALSACDLPLSSSLTPEMLDGAPGTELATMFLSAIEILPTLELEFKPSEIKKTKKTEKSEKPEKAHRPGQLLALKLGSRPSEAKRPDESVGVDLVCDENLRVEIAPGVFACVERKKPWGGEMEMIRVEVFEPKGTVNSLFHNINLRVRVTNLETEQVIVEDVHEEELESWLSGCNAMHLLQPSRENDLVKCIATHAFVPADATHLDFERVNLQDDEGTYRPNLVDHMLDDEDDVEGV
jgi:hypothetical protein